MAKVTVIVSGTYTMVDSDYQTDVPQWQVQEDRKALDSGVIGIADVLEWCEGGLDITLQLEEDK